jgi:protein-L-isoaspartate(D-aspartate) O-methyltransferase
MSIDIERIGLERTRFNMVEQQVRPWDVTDMRVLEALSNVRREQFVPAEYRELAFADTALPLAHGEVMMKPVVEGRMLQALALEASDSVLEVGTGSGFIAACIGYMARDVMSVEIHADFADRARRLLLETRVSNASVITADALGSFDPEREFDAIAITGAVFREPEKFRRWLKLGGRLFLVRGAGIDTGAPVMEAVVITRIGGSEYREQSLFETELPYLVNAAPTKRFAL